MNENNNTQQKDFKNDFKKIVIDFCKDLLNTFPELKSTLNENINILLTSEDNNADELLFVYNYCKSIFPERFFDILYQNTEIFNDDNINTYFLPDIDFSVLWKTNDITEKTRETMWKYLQLILFTVINDVSNGDCFGNSAKLFETINNDEFKTKLEETIENMKTLFNSDKNTDTNINDSSNINLEDLPNAENIHEHISGMMDGKLGKLAREIAEETAGIMNMDMNMENGGSINDAFKQMFNNPNKLMGLVQNIGDKLDKKIKSGEISESDLLEEASEIVKKMQTMPGMNDIQSMLSKMGMGLGMGMGNQNNSNETSHLNNTKLNKMKERMKNQAQQNIVEKSISNEEHNTSLSLPHSDNEFNILKLLTSGSEQEIENLIFSMGEKPEKSVRPQNNNNNNNDDNNDNNDNNKNKKNKKNKNKNKNKNIK